MSEQASFAPRGRNPDVLTCIANLSNDEVFTPPEFANRMLDTLADAWATDHEGANLWADPTARFLDPVAKSGVFLREIASRLTEGLKERMPDLQARVDHILTKQVFGIGITHLTSLLARRSVYCSKHAKGDHSIGKSFTSDDGNIWFQRMEHSWTDTKCGFCGAPKGIFDRDEGLENHAYAFIHTSDIKARLHELFGGHMQFDVVIGNPPYQMTGGAGGTSDSSIYHLFIEQAIRLEPRYLSMVVPSRWMAGGRGLDGFRRAMLAGKKLSVLVDYPVSREVFPGVELKGGICYFLWNSGHDGPTLFTMSRDETVSGPVLRHLDEFDVVIRDVRAVGILNKVLAHQETSVADILTGDTPFGIATNFDHFREKRRAGDVPLYYIRKMKRGVGNVARTIVDKNAHLVSTWKLLVPKAYNGGDGLPHQILGKPLIAPSPSVCTQSFMFFHLRSEREAKSVQSYYVTRFFRFLVSLRKITQDATNAVYTWVPSQTWDRIWTDKELYAKYGITRAEQAFIESQVKEMAFQPELALEDED